MRSQIDELDPDPRLCRPESAFHCQSPVRHEALLRNEGGVGSIPITSTTERRVPRCGALLLTAVRWQRPGTTQKYANWSAIPDRFELGGTSRSRRSDHYPIKRVVRQAVAGQLAAVDHDLAASHCLSLPTRPRLPPALRRAAGPVCSARVELSHTHLSVRSASWTLRTPDARRRCPPPSSPPLHRVMFPVLDPRRRTDEFSAGG
jgi:hypothetical protein